MPREQTLEHPAAATAAAYAPSAPEKEAKAPRRERVSSSIAPNHRAAVQPMAFLAAGGTTAGAALVGGLLLWPFGAIAGGVGGLILAALLHRTQK